MNPIEDRQTVLLIDDSDFIHRLLEQKLRVENVDVRAVSDPERGVEMASRLRPSLILLDLQFDGPGSTMDGFDALTRLKECEQTSGIPVIVLTGSDVKRDKILALEKGAVDYITKPFDDDEMRARVRAGLRIHELMTLLEQRARIDSLTGLWNRAYFDERLGGEVQRLERGGSPFTLAMCDLDRFKSLNDDHGHPAGDAVLRGFAAMLNRALRSHDVACRYGGEEFGLILRDVDAEGARPILERIGAELRDMTWAAHPNRRVTASFGAFDGGEDPPSSPAAWIEAADEALYESKRAGRDRITIARGAGGGGDPNMRLAG